MIEHMLIQAAIEEGEYREKSRMKKLIKQVMTNLFEIELITHQDIEREFATLLKK